MSLCTYFKLKSSLNLPSSAAATVLPSPDGPLSKLVPLSTIQAANDAVEKVINNDFHSHPPGNRIMSFILTKNELLLVIYAVQHSTVMAISIFHKISSIEVEYSKWLQKGIISTTESHRKETNDEIFTTDEEEG